MNIVDHEIITVRVNYVGGLLGYVYSEKRSIDRRLGTLGQEGYAIVHAEPDHWPKLFIWVSYFILLCTYGLYRPRPGRRLYLQKRWTDITTASDGDSDAELPAVTYSTGRRTYEL